MKNSDQPINPCAIDQNVKEEFIGLTKREYFAAMAMQGMLANPTLRYGDDFMMISQKAVTCADELLKQLEK